MDINLGLAFLGGLVSFFSPCVISIVPVFIGYVGGYSFVETSEINKPTVHRWLPFFHSLAFVFGFSLVFIVMGMTVSLIGGYLVYIRWWLIRITGLIILIFGCHITGIFRIKWLDYELRHFVINSGSNGIPASFLMGVLFASGWTPCFGPILGSILALTIQAGSIYNGMVYLIFYSLGMAIPFILAGLWIDWVGVVVKKYKKATVFFEKLMGVILIIMGFLLLTGLYDIFVNTFSNFRLG